VDLLLVKICGITGVEDAILCCEAGADMLGFVFAASPRSVTESRAGSIIHRLPEGVSKVGVFLDQPMKEVEGTASRLGLDFIQLHGDETADFCVELYERTGIGIIKAVCIGDKNDLELLKRYALDSVSFILLDSRVRGNRGGTGKTFPWEVVQGYPGSGNRLIVAGGLTSDNVREAVKKLAPAGVDVSSGVEKKSSPGVKDITKVRRFISEAKAQTA
jgi:phosphoribosylanthranilate isomerase